MGSRNLYTFSLAVILMLAVTACTGVMPRETERTGTPAPVVDLEGGDSAPLAGSEPELKPMEPAESVSSNRATVSLVAQANSLQQKGELESSAAVLERALRIEPRNARLWHRLAAIRLAQGQGGQAINLATKSNSLAAHDQELVEKNNEIIRDARLVR